MTSSRYAMQVVSNFVVLSILLLSNLCSARQLVQNNIGKVYRVDEYSLLDDTQSFLSAWKDACSSSGSVTVGVPKGKTMALSPITLSGPCQASKIQIEIDGQIEAPDNMDGWQGSPNPLIKIEHVDGLTITGSGTIDGRGSSWWSCRRQGMCSSAPRILVINHCNHLTITNLKLKDSPNMHLTIDACNDVHLSQLTITAPKDSPNTDGIDIGDSKTIKILNSKIGTGDDCIAIKEDVFDVTIDRVTCGPGHGISIGSINKGSVSDVTISNCVISDAQNGARIKTWQGGSGYVKNIKYEHITMESVDHPIVIDQYYCNGKHDCATYKEAVEVSDISFIDIHGSSTRKVPIQLECSESVACTNIALDDIQLTSEERDKEVSSSCINAHGVSKNRVSPDVPCLHAG